MTTHHEAQDNFDHHRGAAPLLRPGRPVRMWAFLSLNFTAFVAVNAFWQYLATGRWNNFSCAAYRQTWVTPLGEMLRHPLNILNHPWMILVMGMLLGLVVLTPIVVAVLYRLPHAAALVVVVAAVGHAPMLAIALAAGAVLAAGTRLRSDMPFLAVMLGLLPFGAYLYLFAFAGVEPSVALPLQRWVMYAPFVLAIVIAVVSASVVLLLAKATRFRPGVVGPIVVVLLAAPLAIFYTKVGAEELEYRVLVNELAAGDAVFKEVSLQDWADQHQMKNLGRDALVEQVREDLRQRRRELLGRCEKFLDEHPGGRHAAEVYWLRALCMCVDLDEAALTDQKGGLVRYSAAYVAADSSQVWRTIAERYAESPQAALADWKLGELAMRRGGLAKFREGYLLLNESARRLRAIIAAQPTPAGTGDESIFSPAEPLPPRSYYAPALLEVERLLWLIEQNAMLDDAPESFGAREAIHACLNADPNGAGYLTELEQIRSQTAVGTAIEDNIRLLIARMLDLKARAGELLQIAQMLNRDGSPTDAAVAANYELGMLAMTPAEVDRLKTLWEKSGEPADRAKSLRTPEEYFRIVIAAGQQPWQRLAQEKLALLHNSSR